MSEGGDRASILSDLNLRLVDGLRSKGVPKRIARAFAQVPRHRFIPDQVWDERGNEVKRSTALEDWYRLVYSDVPIVTQHDDGCEGGRGLATSSSSAPSVMAAMLDAAVVEPHMHVLEIGAATGYNAALLCELTGDAESVTTVEVDAALAGQARASLAAAGYHPRVVTGDGALGCPDSGPFDRVIATCAVSRVPEPWIAQTHDGGLVVCPWAPSSGLPGGLLARLMVRDGVAEGEFTRPLSFMWLRGQRGDHSPPHDLGAEAGTVRHVEQDPQPFLLNGAQALPLALMVPAWRFGMRGTPDGSPLVWVSALDSPSWARLHTDRVEQGGPRQLWDEFEAAHQWWREHGRPPATEFGLTVDADGHRVWLGTPEGPTWIHRVR
ncbi:MAG: methyltransferase [Nocardiopsaceae bacterium]|nr:methyltransferase [Nocardiopsaceae bacterium]